MGDAGADALHSAALIFVGAQLRSARWRLHRGEGYSELLGAVLNELGSRDAAKKDTVRDTATSLLEVLANLMPTVTYFQVREPITCYRRASERWDRINRIPIVMIGRLVNGSSNLRMNLR